MLKHSSTCRLQHRGSKENSHINVRPKARTTASHMHLSLPEDSQESDVDERGIAFVVTQGELYCDTGWGGTWSVVARGGIEKPRVFGTGEMR